MMARLGILLACGILTLAGQEIAAVFHSEALSARGAEDSRLAETLPREARVARVAKMDGLVAFWDFDFTRDGVWTSRYDPAAVDRSFPVMLRRIGDANAYRPSQWPYDDADSRLEIDRSGPLGHAVRFNRGNIFGEVARGVFDDTALDIHGRQPFTMIAWVRFVGRRHLVAGIWDEGGWDRYGGRRQVALFGGLFGSRGVIAHVSATGAASYPQSTAAGSQYARLRAIDGAGFDDGQWVAMAMTFDPARDQVRAWLNGVATPTAITDPVARDVFRDDQPVSSNPFHFAWPIFSPRAFILKFNGYDVGSTGIWEHWLHIDLDAGRASYARSSPRPGDIETPYRVHLALQRDGRTIGEPIVFDAEGGRKVALPASTDARPGDTVVASLHARRDGQWQPVGSEVRRAIRTGAPFTFGRAPGLGAEPIEHGSQLYLDGVAVFNRVLTDAELVELSFRP